METPRVFGRLQPVPFQKLPQGLADAFFLRELDGLDAEEVQQILGITPANLWKRLHRARVLATMPRVRLVRPKEEDVLPERSDPRISRLKTLWCLLNLPCEGMSRLASESLDRDLGRLEWVALRSHLLYCAACRRFQRQIKLLWCAMRQLASRVEAGEPSPGTGLPDEVRERIKRALKGN